MFEGIIFPLKFFLKNTSSGSNNFPDKLQYKNKEWYSGIGDNLKNVSVEYADLVYTKEYKNILGYKCEKVTGFLKADNQRFEMWVCDKLPNTLMHAGGLHPLKGAVLEWSFPNKDARFTTVSIKKV